MFPLTQFPYFFFLQLPFSLFYQKLQPEFNFESRDHAQRVYEEWLNIFCKRASVFYQTQYFRHEANMLEEFRRRFTLPEEASPGEYGLDDEWMHMRYATGLAKHKEQYEEVLNQAMQRPDFRSTSERFADRGQNPNSMRVINALWFNTVINNSQEDADKLKQLPYPEYLTTTHWAQVRAAMLLIHRAVCQAEAHFSVGESWYGGWETDINVHHLTYDNRGNERYADLALLCTEHHNQWHKNMDETGAPGFEICDDGVL